MTIELSDNAIKVLSSLLAVTSIKPGESDFLEYAAGLQELSVICKTSMTPPRTVLPIA